MAWQDYSATWSFTTAADGASVAVAGEFPSPSGDVSSTVSMTVSVAGNMPTSTGVTNKMTSKSFTGVMPASTGTLSRTISKLFSGVMPASTGYVNRLTSKSFSGVMPASTGETFAGYKTSSSVQGVFGNILGSVSGVIKDVGVAGSQLWRAIKIFIGL